LVRAKTLAIHSLGIWGFLRHSDYILGASNKAMSLGKKNKISSINNAMEKFNDKTVACYIMCHLLIQ
jgi:hypothetical protein